MSSRRFSLNVNDWPLATKLTVAVLVLLIPATAIINALVLIVLQDSITSQIGNNLYSLADATANTVSNEVVSIVDELQDLARTRPIVNAIIEANAAYPPLAAEAHQRVREQDNAWRAANPGDPIMVALQDVPSSTDLRAFVNADPNQSEVLLADQYGGLVAISAVPNIFDQSFEQWWERAYNNGQGSIYISQPFFDRTVNVFTITVAVPVYRPNSTEVIGVLRTNYRLRNIVDNLAAINVGETGEVLLLKVDGTRLDTTAGDDEKVNEAEWTAIRENTTSNYYTGPFNSRQSLVTTAPVSGADSLIRLNELDWHIVVRQDEDESLAAQRSIVGVGAAIAVIGILIVSLFTVNTARSLVRPIGELTRTALDARGGNLAVVAPVRSHDEVGQLSEAFNGMIGEIRTLTGSLEAQVTERTAQLEADNEISSTIAGSLELSRVLSQTVNLIRDRLGYYQVSIFLLDERGENAIVRESTGEVGRILKERPHTLAVGSQSIIGFVTANRRPRVALDTGVDAIHFKNPLLPDTRSELALPLLVGDTLFGALDVQSTQPNAFDDQDVAVLQNMANQIAIAINNARLFQETQSRLEEISTLNRQYLARAWEAFSTDRPDSVNLQLEGGFVSPAPEISIRHNPITITTPILAQDGTSISIPISLRDEIIGEFSLSAPEGSARWGEDELALVDAVVAQVALAVENARLLEETQVALGEANRLARRERIISDISTKISFGSDVRRILQIAADELRRATGSSRTVVKLTGSAQELQQETA